MKLKSAYLGLVALLAVFAAMPVVAEAKVKTKGLAVVLIDMQYGFYDRGGVVGTPGLEALVQKQIELLDWAVAEKVPVIVFEYDGFRNTDTRLMDRLVGANFEVITKENDDGFTDPSKAIAMKALIGWNADTVLVAGINGCCCVQGTAMGAIQNGFDVITSSDIVGNINYNPPTYPNNTWYFKDKKFTVYADLKEMTGGPATPAGTPVPSPAPSPAPRTTWPREIDPDTFKPFGTVPFANVK